MIKILKNIFQLLFGVDSKSKRKKTKYKKPPIYFESVTVVNKTPSNHEVLDRVFIVVTFQCKPIWALFRCPCGCQHVISLSLQRIHKTFWKVNLNKEQRPTLNPSVWQIEKCHSHFWVKDGRIYWV